MHASVIRQQRRNGASDAVISRMVRYIDGSNPDVLVMGFARRFATYKRALLLFADPERLARILGDPERPAVIIFAGKAHPHDEPGQHLIKRIHDFSVHPDFIGKIILLEGYDMALARHMVTGVDVWLNTPEYPQEASGTSGQKAGLNGAVNLSVLDGWWGEGYNGHNGWGITPRDASFDHEHRQQEEANDLLNILEHEMFPSYYSDDADGYSPDWVRMSKNSMKSTIPRFNAQRMLRGQDRMGSLPVTATDVIPVVESLLTDPTHSSAVVMDYFEMIAPNSDPSFMPHEDKANLVSLQRWSF